MSVSIQQLCIVKKLCTCRCDKQHHVKMLMHFCHCVITVHHKSGFQEVLAETDAVESLCGIVAMTLSGQLMYAMYALLFHLPSV